MGQWETHIQGYPIRIDTRLQSRAWDDCPPLEKGPNVKEIKCNNSTCVMKCMPGFVKVSFFLHRNPRKFWLRINISGNRSHFKMTNDGLRLEFTIMSPDKLWFVTFNCHNPDYLSNNPSEKSSVVNSGRTWAYSMSSFSRKGILLGIPIGCM